jgi:allantoinase
MGAWIIQGKRVVLPDGMRAASILVENGRIGAIDPKSYSTIPLIDVGSHVVMPGLVDTHVHVNEPGRAHWEGFETATRAAAAGGITTLVDMPLNSIPATTSVAALEAKRRAAPGRCHVDVGFWGGIVPGNERELAQLAAAGVLGFKCFLSPSGVDEFPNVNERDLRIALPLASKTGLPVLAHAEWPPLLQTPDPRDDPRRYATWLRTRPPAAEQAAIELLIDLASRADARLHIVHLASADALPAIKQARAGGTKISVETCPHYLAFCAEQIRDGDTALKCAPPIRERDHQDRLWRALQNGEIDLIATDHSPAPAEIKHLESGNFLEAWGGIASLQVSLPVVWTAASRRGIPIERLAHWMSAAPAMLAGLDRRKGAIAVGRDADFVVVDPDREIVVDASRLYHRHPITPYDGARLKGLITMTMLRGEIVYQHGECVGGATGELLSGSP